MPPTDRKPLSDYFAEGLDARRSGRGVNDNPYEAGSLERREWDAGFSASTEVEDDDRLKLDPNEDAKVRTSD